MIVEISDPGDLAGKVAMVDGCFDPLHDGYIGYSLRPSAALARERGAPSVTGPGVIKRRT